MVLPEKNWVNLDDDNLIHNLNSLLGEENVVVL